MTPLPTVLFRRALACALLLSVLPAFAQSTPAADAHLERKVEQKLDSKPALKDVQAQVDDGVATLSGKVPTPPDRTEAATVAKDVQGVKRVDNRVELDPDVRVRFNAALNEVKGKLIRLVASLPLVVIALAIVLLAIWLGDVVSRRMRLVQRLSRHNPYMDGLARTTAKTLVIVAGLLMALNLLGATSLVGAVLGSAGVVGLVLGFGFKDIVENYIAGVLLSIRQPFNPGDLVRIDSYEGRVASLTSRATQLVTLDGNQLTLPNALVFKSVMLNYTHNPRRRFDFTTNVATSASWNEAMDLGIRTMRGIEGVLADPAPTALIKELSDGAATIQYFGWIDQTRNDLSKTRSEAMRLVRRRLRDAGITPPDGVQKVAMIRMDGSAADAASRESADPRDTSVDRTLDSQVSDAGVRDDANLLKPDGDPTAPPA